LSADDFSPDSAEGTIVLALTVEVSFVTKIPLPKNKKSRSAAVRKKSSMVILRFINSGFEPDKESLL